MAKIEQRSRVDMFGKPKFSFTKEDICFIAFSETITGTMPRTQGFKTVQMRNSDVICSVFDTPNLQRHLAVHRIDTRGALALPMNFSQHSREAGAAIVMVEQLRIVRGLDSIAVINTEEVGLAIYISMQDAIKNGWIRVG